MFSPDNSNKVCGKVDNYFCSRNVTMYIQEFFNCRTLVV